MSLNVLLFSQSEGFLNENPHVMAVIKLAHEKNVTLVASGASTDKRIRTLAFPRVTDSIPKTTTPAWREACRPVVDAIDALEDIDAILVFDESTLRILTATRVPQKPVIWVGDITPFATPKMTRYTSCSLRLTHALFVPETLTEDQIKALCAWEKHPPQTLPAIKSLVTGTFFDHLSAILANPNPALPAQIELDLRANKLHCLGGGSRRICHQIGDTGLCVKHYHLPETISPEKRSYETLKKEITTYAHNRQKNTSCQEYDYFQEITNNKPKEIVSIFPEMVEIVYFPTYGWGLIETQLTNHDGTPVQHVADLLANSNPDSPRYVEILHKLTEFVGLLATHAITFYDLQNISIQMLENGGFRFRIMDFEPGNRQLISFFMKHPFFIRRKIWRRFYRTLALYKITPIE